MHFWCHNKNVVQNADVCRLTNICLKGWKIKDFKSVARLGWRIVEKVTR